MENGEKKMLSPEDTDLSGYSERKADKDIELHAGQWLDLKQTKKPKVTKPQQQTPSIQSASAYPSQKPTGSQMAILLEYQQQIWTELSDAISHYRLELKDGNDVSSLLQEIQQLQTTLGSVLKALRFEQKGSLDISKLPKEVQNLLK